MKKLILYSWLIGWLVMGLGLVSQAGLLDDLQKATEEVVEESAGGGSDQSSPSEAVKGVEDYQAVSGKVALYNQTGQTIQVITNRGLNFNIDQGSRFLGNFDDQVTIIEVQYRGSQTPFAKGQVAIGRAYAITPAGIVAK